MQASAAHKTQTRLGTQTFLCAACAITPLPFLDAELRLLAARLVPDLELDIFGIGALIERQRRAAPVIAPAGPLSGEYRDEFVLAGLQIAHVEALNAAAVQGLRLAFGVEIIRHYRVVDLQRYRVEIEQGPDIHRDEYRYLRARGKQQLFF